jgi:hypothetical protein
METRKACDRVPSYVESHLELVCLVAKCGRREAAVSYDHSQFATFESVGLSYDSCRIAD